MSLSADNVLDAIRKVVETDLKKTIKDANTIQKINL
jgi:hypothetical protein